jgi:hypothetical protein
MRAAISGLAAAVAITIAAVAPLPAEAHQLPSPHELRSPEVPQWSVHEITLTARDGYNDPYTDAGVSATFNGPDHAQKHVQGFWDGADVWRVRFNCSQQGRWTWSTSSTDPGLNNRSGTVICSAARRGAHGFLRRDPKHPYSFVRDDGTREFVWGNTAYDVLLNVAGNGDWKHFVDETAAHGMNKIRLQIYANQTYAPGVEDQTYPQVIPFQGSYTAPDHDRLNIDYWRNLDRYVEYAASRGVNADILIFTPYGYDPATGNFAAGYQFGTQAQDERLLRYAIARYAAFPNVQWNLSNEFHFAGKPNSYWDTLGTSIRNEDPWMANGDLLRPLSVHGFGPGGEEAPWPFLGAAWPTYAGPEAELYTSPAYFAGGATTSDEEGNATIVRDLGFSIPVVDDEYGYMGVTDGRCPTPCDRSWHRHAIWGIATAGGYGSVGDFRREPTGNPEVSGDWVPAPEYADIQRLVDFFTTKGIRYWETSSHNELVTSGSRVYALANPGRQYVIYAATGGQFSINLAPGTYRARRYDPSTGKDVPLGTVHGAGSHVFTTPASTDWVVYLEH